MSKKKPTRFIRKNGRIIPIYEKDPSKKKMKENYMKHGDGARQYSVATDKLDKKANKAGMKFGLAAAGFLGGSFAALGANRLKLGSVLGVAGLGSLIASGRKKNKALKSQEVERENIHVRLFGMGMDGQKPKKLKKKKK